MAQRKRWIGLMSATLIVFTLRQTPADPPAFSPVIDPRQWVWPRDHGRHDGFKIEWWYFTGNVRDDSGRPFGYQLTFFRTALAPHPIKRESPWGGGDLYFAHAAVSDLKTRQFFYKDRTQRGHPSLARAADGTLDVSLLDWSAKLDGSTIALRAAEDQFAIDLKCTLEGDPVLEGPGGINRKGNGRGQASYYYSMPRLATRGTLTIGGQSYRVEGLSWMDHEFSSEAMSADQIGWDWMGMQLDDGNSLMIYRLRGRDATDDYLSGTWISADGRPRYLSANDITLKPSAPWKSPDSGGVYPQVWNITVAGAGDFQIRSAMPGQELRTGDSTGITYFEGASLLLNAAGKRLGQGYLEMTGYAASVSGKDQSH